MTADTKIQKKFADARAALCGTLIERDEEVDLVLTALAAGEHALLVGPPGTGKSMLVDSLMGWLDARKFSVLMTKTLSPEDVFGPLDIQEFVHNKTWARVTAGWLPEAEVSFLDEIWKSSGAILNTLLKILNEGLFQNNGAWHKVPLRLCVAASNEWPSPDTGQELSALLDRFVLRKTVAPIATRAGEERLYDFDGARAAAPAFASRISPAEVDRAVSDARSLPWTDAAKEAFREVVAKLAAEGIRPGDRRRYKAVGVARGAAYLAGADAVAPEHLEVLQHVLWDDPAEQPQKAREVVLAVANPDGYRVSGLLTETEEILRSFDRRDLASYAAADAKLQEIDRKLAAMNGNARAKKARAYVKDQIRQVRLATVAHNEAL